MVSSSSTLPWKHRLLEPHAFFWLCCLTVKLVIPSLLKYLAYDTISTTILSVWYPVCATITLIHRESQPTDTSSKVQSLQAARERKFWIDYWVAGFSLAQWVHQTILLMPIVLRWSFEYSFLPKIMAEMKLLFFVWIFAMEPLLTGYQSYLAMDRKESSVRDFLPCTLLKRAIQPRLLDLHAMICDPISKENWTRFIHSKAHKLLNLLVALQFLTEEWCDHLLHLLDECRSLLLLAPFLVLPSTITRIGILYAQFVLPSARSLLARGKIIEVLYLQYWVLNMFFATGVSLGSWLLWFVPFSTQIVFAIWCYLTFPQTITQYYAVIETELIAFGILSGESQLSVEETKTVQALRAVVKRIPSANDAEGFQWVEAESLDGKSKSRKKMVPRSNSAPATLLAISAMKAMHDSAMNDSISRLLSPQKESEEEEDSDTEPEKPVTPKPAVVDKRSKSLSFGDRRAQNSFKTLSSSTRGDDDDGLSPIVSMMDEDDDDDASQRSTKAMVNIDLSSIYDEVEVTMKELSAARLRAAKFAPKVRSPSAKFPYADETQRSTPKPYHSPLRSSIMREMSDDQEPQGRHFNLTSPDSSSRQFASNTPRSQHSCGFELSDIDTTASSTAVETIESFESTFEATAASRFKSATATVEEIARRAARRSERIRKLQEKKEARKLNQLTESLLFMRSASTDSEDTSRSFGSKMSETSSSTDYQALAEASKPDQPRMRRRRQGSSERHEPERYTLRTSLGSNARNLSDSSNSRQQPQPPRYVRVDSSQAEIRQRRAQRSRSRDNNNPLVSVDSDKRAQ
jgi:hypothetical protein